MQGMQMMLYTLETDMIMMVTSYAWSFPVEVGEAFAEVETGAVTEAIGDQVLQQDDHNTGF